MLAALIGLTPPGDGPAPEIGGRPVSAHQADFALQLGCELVLAEGHGATAEALALRHRVERAGARFQAMATIHALAAAVGPEDSLLVLQPGLLPDAAEAGERLHDGPAVLVISAGVGAPAGFERIDLDRAWAGAMIVPGAVVAQGDTLPEDAAPAPALLRIALQHRVAERRLSDAMIDRGDWIILPDQASARAHEPKWLQRQLGAVRITSPSHLLAGRLLQARGGDMLRQRRLPEALYAVLALLPCAALISGWLGHAVPAFALLALAAPLLAMVTALEKLAALPSAKAGRRRALDRVPHLAIDLALVVVAGLALDGPWYRVLFAPAVIGMALLLLDRHRLPLLADPLRDRGVVALLGALAIAILPSEPALTGLALLLIAGNLLAATKGRG